jgi:hypothetical protein
MEHIVHQTLDRGRVRHRYESMWTVTDNGEVTGYVMAGFHRNGGKIEQICVRHDARRMERALRLEAMVDAEARARTMPCIRCRVAVDLEANLFWTAAGYSPIATTTSTWVNQHESKSRRPLIVYEKRVCQPMLFQARAALEGVDGPGD